MRINVWIVLIVLIAFLFAVTRLLRYHQDTQRVCADDPSASVCGRGASRLTHRRFDSRLA